jgi:hypothetical protein
VWQWAVDVWRIVGTEGSGSREGDKGECSWPKQIKAEMRATTFAPACSGNCAGSTEGGYAALGVAREGREHHSKLQQQQSAREGSQSHHVIHPFMAYFKMEYSVFCLNSVEKDEKIKK